jgi:hypothetical protein
MKIVEKLAMKMKEFHRMQKNKKSDNKDSGEKNEKSSRQNTADSSGKKQPRKQLRPKRGKTGGDDDDESVDSKGNIRGLISYSEEEEASTTSDITESDEDASSPSEGIAKRVHKRTPRKSAVIARKKISKKVTEKPSSPKKKSSSSKLYSLKKKSKKVVEDSEDEDDDFEDEEADEDEVEDDDEEDEEDEEEDEDEDDEDDEEVDEDDEEDESRKGKRFIMSFGMEDDSMERRRPKRHNMKKETEEVKKFVKLMTTPVEESTIDDQIDYFKTLSIEKQKHLNESLERKANIHSEQPLIFKILTKNLPAEAQSMVLAKYNSLETMDTSSGEYFKLRNWLEKISSMPFGIYKDIPIRIDDSEGCTKFMEQAKLYMESAIFGQQEAKLQILQFIASKIANPNARGLSLMLVGPPGIGKTSLIKNGIAKALDWPFQFISLGGDSDATTYTGHQLVYEGSHCGKIVNSLVAAKSMSMVLMFDELDKISGTPKGEEVQNMLIHLTDPVQNADFEDKYLTGIPIDLSKVMFVFSGNDLNKIDRILLDRMVVVKLNGYSAKEKLAIAEDYLIPQALKEVNLAEKVGISSDVIQHIIKDYTGEEPGVRELKRCVEQIVQRINMLRMFNSKELPFHIKDFSLPFLVKKEHIDLFLKKKEGLDVSVQRMYT